MVQLSHPYMLTGKTLAFTIRTFVGKIMSLKGTTILEVWCFLKKLNILLLYDPAIMFLGIYPKELKTYICTKSCTQVFIAALFLIAKSWEQQRYSWAGEWIRKPVVHLNNGILFSAKKMSYLAMKIHDFFTEWKKSVLKDQIYCMIPTIWHSGKGKTLEPVARR